MTFLTAIFIGGAIPTTIWRSAMFCDTAIVIAGMIAATIQTFAKR